MKEAADSGIARLKEAVSLEELVRNDGIALTPHGRDLAGICPFHGEKTPSLIITPDKNLWHCMGCGMGGSVIDWVMQREGVDLREACRRLRALAGTAAAAKGKKRSERPVPGIRTEAHQKAVQWALNIYRENLRNSPRPARLRAGRRPACARCAP